MLLRKSERISDLAAGAALGRGGLAHGRGLGGVLPLAQWSGMVGRGRLFEILISSSRGAV